MKQKKIYLAMDDLETSINWIFRQAHNISLLRQPAAPQHWLQEFKKQMLIKKDLLQD